MPKHNLLKNKDLTIIIYNICRLISQCLKFVGKYNTQKKITLYYQGVEGENLIKKDSRLRFDRNLLFFLYLLYGHRVYCFFNYGIYLYLVKYHCLAAHF